MDDDHHEPAHEVDRLEARRAHATRVRLGAGRRVLGERPLGRDGRHRRIRAEGPR
jgi:hypothetical protein